MINIIRTIDNHKLVVDKDFKKSWKKAIEKMTKDKANEFLKSKGVAVAEG